MKLINAGNKKRRKRAGVYFVQFSKTKGVMNKTILETYEVNNSVNCLKYEGTCLRGNFRTLQVTTTWK